MADLSGVSLDPDVKADTGGFTVMKPGLYKGVIVNDKLHKTQTGGLGLKLRVQITDGEYAGVTIDDFINIQNKSEKAQKIGQGQLRNICELCDIPYPPKDTTGLYGKPMAIEVFNESFTSNTTGKELSSNKVKGYKKLSVLSLPQTNQAAPPQQTKKEDDGW